MNICTAEQLTVRHYHYSCEHCGRQSDRLLYHGARWRAQSPHATAPVSYQRCSMTDSSAGNEIGPGTSALRWPSCALLVFILRCWQGICIRCQNSATRPHCNNEAAEHLVLQCLAHDKARWDIWPGGKFNTDPRHLWDFLEQTRPT